MTEGYLETVVPLLKDVPLARRPRFQRCGEIHRSTAPPVTWSPLGRPVLPTTPSTTCGCASPAHVTSERRISVSCSRPAPADNHRVCSIRSPARRLPTFQNQTVGNPNLKPEEADTTGIGIVFQPSFLTGFSTSVDYYDIDVAGAVSSVGAQETLNRCILLGQQSMCDNITRDGNEVVTMVTSLPINLNNLRQKGVDIEASYAMDLGSLDVSVARQSRAARAGHSCDHFATRRWRESRAGLRRRQLRSRAAELALAVLGHVLAGRSSTAVWTGRSLSSGEYNPQLHRVSFELPGVDPERADHRLQPYRWSLLSRPVAQLCLRYSGRHQCAGLSECGERCWTSSHRRSRARSTGTCRRTRSCTTPLDVPTTLVCASSCEGVADAVAVLSRFLLIGAAALGVGSTLGGCSKSMPSEVAAAYERTPTRVRRMSQEQYANTIAYIFGRDIDVGTPFAPLRRTDGLLAAGAASAGVTAGELQQLQRSAAVIAAQVLDKGSIEHKTPSRRDFLVPCKPADEMAADDACATTFVQHVGRLLFRHPLETGTTEDAGRRSKQGRHRSA